MSEETDDGRTTTEAEEAAAAEKAGEAGETTAALLTANQVAGRLGISTRRLRDWRKEGKIAEVGRFKRGTAKIPLFDPRDVARLERAQAAEETGETPATAVATAAPLADQLMIAETVARQVRVLLAERAEAEAAAVAPLVELVREQQATIDDLRHRAEAAEVEVARQREIAQAIQAERDRLIAAQAAPAPPHEPGGQEAHTNATDPPGGILARVRRFFGGE